LLPLEAVPSLRCPRCRGPLAFRGIVRETDGLERLREGALRCRICSQTFSVTDGLASLYSEEHVRGTDRLLRFVYDGLPSVHDPLVRFSFPWAVGESESQSRSRYLERLGLDELELERAAPVRILEVGAGTGSNIALLRAMRPWGARVELWAVDLSLGMLSLLRERLRFLGDTRTRCLAVDAHALPFADGFFDRVFHVGAVNGYRDPKTALAEMARVARPDTPIVVVDERLDPSRRHGLAHRLFFKWMTIYDRDPHAPVESLPEGATDIRVEQLGRFFYCLRFRMAGAPAIGAGTP
jgi:SAM-dependent methyltransferase